MLLCRTLHLKDNKDTSTKFDNKYVYRTDVSGGINKQKRFRKGWLFNSNDRFFLLGVEKVKEF